MKSAKGDYEICKMNHGIREDLLNFLSFYTLVIYHVFTTRSNKCTSKILKYSKLTQILITIVDTFLLTGTTLIPLININLII